MGGYKRWARLEELASDDLNDYLGSQVVMRFATTAARAASLPFPEEGMVSLITATGALEVYLPALGGWTPPPNVAWGRPRDVQGQGASISGATGVLLDFGTFTPDPSRRYRLEVMSQTEQAAGDGWNLALRCGSTDLNTIRTIGLAQQPVAMWGHWNSPATPAPVVVNLGAARVVGAAPITPLAGMTHRLTITDVGPSTAGAQGQTLPAPTPDQGLPDDDPTPAPHKHTKAEQR